MHRDVAHEFAEFRIAGDKVGLAVDLDEYADLAAGMNVTSDGAFVCGTLFFFLRLGLTEFCEPFFGLFDIAARFEKSVTASTRSRSRRSFSSDGAIG